MCWIQNKISKSSKINADHMHSVGQTPSIRRSNVVFCALPLPQLCTDLLTWCLFDDFLLPGIKFAVYRCENDNYYYLQALVRQPISVQFVFSQLACQGSSYNWTRRQTPVSQKMQSSLLLMVPRWMFQALLWIQTILNPLMGWMKVSFSKGRISVWQCWHHQVSQ